MRTSEVERSPAEGKPIDIEPNYKEYWKALVYAYSVQQQLCCRSESQLKGILWPLCKEGYTRRCIYIWQAILKRLYVCACMRVVVIKVEWQSAWSEVTKQQPPCSSLRSLDSHCFKSAVIGTIVLLTPADFHRLIPCPVWLSRSREPSTSHYTFSFVFSNQSYKWPPFDTLSRVSSAVRLREMTSCQKKKNEMCIKLCTEQNIGGWRMVVPLLVSTLSVSGNEAERLVPAGCTWHPSVVHWDRGALHNV